MMSDQVRKVIRKSWRGTKALIYLALVALTGCFGPPAMHYDIQQYNKAVLSSEEEMLLYNIGELHYKQPPHFMMLSEVDQTRTFTANAAFSWTNLSNRLFIANGTKSGITTNGTNTWQAGPFSAGATESPIVKLNPLQGQDFAQRLESSLTDKFTLFLEDLRWYGTLDERKDLVLLFAQSLDLEHGDDATNGGQCGRGLYFNRRFQEQDLETAPNEPHHYSGELSECVGEILRSHPNYVLIDASHPIPTSTAEGPKAADVVSAWHANYQWVAKGKEFVLANRFKIPAWLDYNPRIVSPQSKQQSPDSLPPVWWYQQNKPDWHRLKFNLPDNYHWKENVDDKKDDEYKYALVPDGYVLNRDENGKYKLAPKEDGPKKKGGVPRGEDQLSYSAEILSDVWPVPHDFFYVELRKGVGDATAEQVCHPQPDNPYDEKKDDHKNDTKRLVCGYFKIGNLLQIMQRLAEMACKYEDQGNIRNYCSQSIFGIGRGVPSWADYSASYQHLSGPYKIQTESVWVPAHNPKTDYDLAQRDRMAFFNLYKLYQMSLVDTSKLVTGSTPISISK
jgi:hypothetical protein